MATGELETKTHGDYTVGWVCALSEEQTAATAMLDKRHGDLQKPHHDSNTYTLGSIGKHNVVIACLPEGRYGTNAAANVVTLLAGTFPSVRSCLMVGIGGGIPSNKVRLGDVVVGRPEGQFPGVVQWDMGRTKQGGEFERTGALDNPPKALLTALAKLKTDNVLNGSKIPKYLNEFKNRYPKAAEKYLRSDSLVDMLFKASYNHITPVKPDKNAKAEDSDDDDEEEEEEEEEQDSCRLCDKTKVVKRKPRDMHVHYGLIASGNQVIKDAKSRDKLNKDLGGNILCVEMEAAGIVNNFPCLVIRGICDYSDSHKNKAWQEYAAAVAAAYAKELLFIVQPNEVQGDCLIKDVLNDVQEMKWTLNEIVVGQKQHAIFEWLSPLSPSARHFENQKTRVKNTGTWLLNDPKFLDWPSKIAKCQVLCCYGDPGAGKTIISSLVIDHLREHIVPGSKIGLGYMYCDYRDQEKQTIENILGAVLTQLLRSLPEMPEAVLKLYRDRANQKKPLSLEDANNLLDITCAQFSKVYVCLDALDELRDLWGLLKCLRDRPSSIQIFLTGRPHVQETVQEYFKEEHSITIKAHESDIQLFIEHEIGGPNDIEPKAMDERLRMDILKKLVNSAKGIFLLPTLQIRDVLQATTLRDREEALKELPSNLGEAFTGTMTRIQQQPVALSERAAKIIAWIHLAEWPLTINELLCSLAIQDGDTCFNPRGLPVRETLLNCCHGLVAIDQETSTVRLVHYSLQQYLVQQEHIFGINKVQWHSEIAGKCLTFLRFPHLRAGDGLEGLKQNHTAVALLNYAARHWGHHLRRSEKEESRAFELGKKYLSSNWMECHSSLRLLYSDMEEDVYISRVYMDVDMRYSMQQNVLPTHIAAFFGLGKIISALSTTVSNLDMEDVNGRTPLSWAAGKGHEAAVQVLIGKGAAVDSVDKNGWTPLSWAAGRHEAVVKVLIEKGAETYTKALGDGAILLSWAARRGYKEAVTMLIDKGAIVDSTDGNGRTPLSLAAEKGYETVVQVLIEKGAAVNSADKDGRIPLSWAAEMGHQIVAQVLIEKGAVVNSADKDGRTPLSWTAGEGHETVPLLWAGGNGYEAVVQMLIEQGAAVDSVDKNGWTPLSWAAERGHEAVIKVMIEKGAETYTKALGDGAILLSWAAQRGYEVAVTMLIDKGATVDSTDGNGRTPLSLAAEKGYETVVQVLIEKGAAVNSADKYGWTPMSWAAGKGHEKVVQGLIEEGAAVDLVNKKGRASLSWAALAGHEAVVKVLVEKGAAVNSADKDGWTPLSCAVEIGHEALVYMLIENGATVDSADKGGDTPLMRASKNGHEAIVSMLIENGAAVDSANKDGWAPLSWAVEKGHTAVAQMLIENGAATDSGDQAGRTLLFRAVENGHEAVAQMLIEKGVAADSVDKAGRTPLSRAVENGHEAVVYMLIENGAAVDSVDNLGWTPLLWAAGRGHEALVKMLIEKGAETYTKALGDGAILLSWAARRGYKMAVTMLIDKGATVDSADKNGRTPLSWAAWKGHETVVHFLIEAGAAVNSADKAGRTPLLWAMKNGQEATVNMLIEKGAERYSY